MNFKGKKGLVFGVANHRSIAYHIAKVLSNNVAEIGYSFQNERVMESVSKSLKDINPKFLLECDVLKEESIKNFLLSKIDGKDIFNQAQADHEFLENEKKNIKQISHKKVLDLIMNK